MEITKKLETEILAVMDNYWGSYLNGDLQTWASYLPDNFRNIGTTQMEIWNSKKEMLEFTEMVVDQMVGMAEWRNKKTQIIPYDPYLMVHELGEVYVNAEEGWIFYAQIRLSSLLEKTVEGWKVLHQHGSYPDSKTEEGETLAFNELKAENKKLRDAIQSRTIDLERKNRELEIEAGLERIRAASLAMHHTSELQQVVNAVHNQLSTLEIPITGGAFIFINNEEVKKELTLWGAGGSADTVTKVKIPFLDRPIYTEALKFIQNGPGLYTEEYAHEEKIEFFEHMFKHPPYNQTPPGRKEELMSRPGGYTRSLFISKNTGVVIINHQGRKFTDDENNVLKRIGIVFEQAYTRFLDLQRAEAQAREAQIEAALERVRGASMAMIDSSALSGIIYKLYSELTKLDAKLDRAFIMIVNPENQGITWWLAGKEGLLAKNGFFIQKNEHSSHLLYLKKWQNRTKKWQYLFNGNEKKDWDLFGFNETELSRLPDFIKEDMAAVKSVYLSGSSDQFGSLVTGSFEPLPEEQQNIISRFATVFNQTYTRFLDLQRAEAQAREAQIEAALEKVRSRSLAVNKVDEFNEVVSVVFEKLSELDIPANTVTIMVNKGETKDLVTFGSAIGETGLMTVKFELPYFNTPMMDDIWEVRSTSEQGYYSKVYSQEEKNHYYEFAFKNTELKNLPDDLKQQVWQSKEYAISAAYAKNSMLGVNDFEGNVLGEDQADIIRRFSKVFEQAYIRFLDLQRAEAQARESQIEAAVERVRAQSMAMHHSDDLDKVNKEILNQLNWLRVPGLTGVTFYLVEANGWVKAWDFSSPGNIGNPNSYALQYDFNEYEMLGEPFRAFWQTDLNYYVADYPFEKLQRAAYELEEILPAVAKIFKEALTNGILTHQWSACARISDGLLGIDLVSPPSEDTKTIVLKIASAFNQAYQRFLDLQKAETQAREAKIEASLERVRSRTMAMHKTDELQEVVRVVAEELKNTGVILDTWGAVICTYFQDSNDVLHWTAAEDPANPSIGFLLPYFKDELYDEAWTSKNRGDSYFAKVFSFEVKNAFFKHAFEHSDYRYLPDDYKKTILESESHGIAWAWANNSAIMIPSVQGDLPSEAEKEILIRFAKVFEQAYVRFMDLQKAEEQAREARIELSLERIRAKVTAMQESSDLLDIVVSMRTEFVRLGHEAHYFWHMRWLPETYAKAMTSGDGTKIGMVMTLPRSIHGEIESVASWEKSDEPTYILAMDADFAVDYVDKMITLGDFERVDPQAPTLDDIRHIGGLTFIMARTTHGEIGYSLPGKVPNPPKDGVETLKRFAGVFDLAYKRFEDLKAAERQALMIREERDRLEFALNELHATQAQLIQQEKLASLGQLTAGIAHEIKNPLNFVNNFSEVSIEMVDEIREEVKTQGITSQEIITELLDDIQYNLNKIHEHGSRANNIVNSMLQHSRGGSGKIEAIDLNALIKEYVNLSFHGMRAGKKPINVDINLDLDDAITEVQLIAEDFSRVILNLCNNAFDAMKSVVKPQYLATLAVRTMKTSDKIIIEVEDNGPGIPDDIKDKILQPFFTTKKGTEGTGLGLSITNDIVKAHGGELKVESTHGSNSIQSERKTGSIFSIILPAKSNK